MTDWTGLAVLFAVIPLGLVSCAIYDWIKSAYAPEKIEFLAECPICFSAVMDDSMLRHKIHCHIPVVKPIKRKKTVRL